MTRVRAQQRPAAEPNHARTARPPEPREVLAAAGRPLDPGLRRDLEGRLGHDFSRVRVHTDRDAALLAELVGADAVTVGQDIFFASGAYRPDTADGRRLLAHELLHTIQVPDAPGALRAGRDPGVLSLPFEPLEREAEQGARALAEEPVGPRPAPGATWLRYATVSAEQYRAERLDPATLVDRLAAGILRSLRGDPTDASGRVRLQLARFAPQLRDAVLDKLQTRLPSPEHARLLELTAQDETAPVASSGVPQPVIGITERGDSGAGADGPRPGEDDAERNAGDDAARDPRDRERGDRDRAPEEEPEPEDREGEDVSREDEERDGRGEEERDREKENQENKDQKEEEKGGKESKNGKESEEEKADRDQEAGEKERREEKGERQAAEEAQPAVPGQPGAPPLGAPGAQPPAGQVGGGEPLAAAPVGAGGAEPVQPERVDQIAEAPDSPLVRHGLVRRRGAGGDAAEDTRPEEEPLGAEPAATAELPVPEPPERLPGEPAQEQQAERRAQRRLEDYLPKSDFDVSRVPTAEEELRLPESGAPPRPKEAPSFPAPPPVEAEHTEESEETAGRLAEPAGAAAGEATGPAAAPGERVAAPQPAPVEEAAEPRADDVFAAVDAEADRAGAARAELAPAAGGVPAAAQLTGTEPAGTLEGAPGTATAEPAGAGPDAGPAGTPGSGAEPIGLPAGGGLAGPEPAGLEAGGPAGPDGMAGPGSVGAPGPDPAALNAGPGRLPQDASLEPGGGGCAGAPEPVAGAQSEAEGGGCGGGAAPGGEQAQPARQAPPDVSGQEPQAALATVGQLPPARLQAAIGGVAASVNRSVGQERGDLRAAPPTLDRPSGAPQTRHGPPQAAPPVESGVGRAEKVAPASRQKGPEGRQVAGGRTPADQVRTPHVGGDTQGDVTADEVRNVQDAVNRVPTTDPALHVTVGPAPQVELRGETDPALTDQQAARLREQSGEIHSAGRQDAARPLGEDQIYPEVPAETLTAQVPAGGGAGPAAGPGGPGGGAGPGGPGGAEAVSVVAQQERGPQIQAAVAEGQGRLGAERRTKEQTAAQAREQHRAEVAAAIAESGEQQAAERGRVAEEARAQRAEWRAEQDRLVADADTEAGREHGKARADIDKERADTDQKIEKKQQEDNRSIEREREEAERKAREERERKQEESSGWLGWIKSKIKAAFDALVNAIKQVFAWARQAVQRIIDGFKRFVTEAIEAARRAIVGLINAVATVLIAIGDRLLAAFPQLRDRFRRVIEGLRDAAIAKVNEYADRLKAGIQKLLDALAAGLNRILDALEQGLLAAVEFVRSAVNRALDWAQAAIQALGQLAALVADIAPDPLGWLGKLGSAAREGIRSHLWGAIKRAVKQWFNEKVESILGLGKAIFNILIRGCLSMARIGRMAWDALVKSLPVIIVTIVIEKLVSMIIPAAGAVLTIVQGLMAAWGTISRIIAAFGKFFAFLKAVKGGNAACLFAEAVAAGAVALLEFITNFLLSRLAMAAKGVASRLKGIAQRITQGLRRGARSTRQAAGRAATAARRGLQASARALRRGAQSVRRGAAAGARAVARTARRTGQAVVRRLPRVTTAARRAMAATGRAVRTGLRRTGRALRTGRRFANSRLGQVLRRGAQRLRDTYRRTRDRMRDWYRQQDRRRQRREQRDSQEAKQRRLDLIVARIRPALERLLRGGVRGGVLRPVLHGMRAWYRLTALRVEGARNFLIRAVLNPDKPVVLGATFEIAGIKVEVDRQLRAIRRIGEEIEASGAVTNVGPTGQQPRAREGWLPKSGGRRHAVRAEEGARGGEVQAALRRRRFQPGRRSDVVQFLADTVNPIEVFRRFRSRSARQQPNPRNRLVDVTDPTTGKTRGVSYEEFKDILKRTGNEQEIAEDALGLLAGRTPRGPHPRLAAEANTWVIHQEGHRNIGALATHAMALDMAVRGEATLQEAVDRAPMSPGGAPQEARHLTRYLNESRQGQVNTSRKWVLRADQLAQRELQMIKLWVESLKDLKIRDSATAQEKERELILEIRRRIHEIYGLREGEAAGADDFLKSLENTDVIL
ncbi:eCIS core domain-containing protein [Carbonactinospora thermoautotrophica]|nr:DUF4157 domain-containing protein [Carbonactinospora thermoautotrophica]